MPIWRTWLGSIKIDGALKMLQTCSTRYEETKMHRTTWKTYANQKNWSSQNAKNSDFETLVFTVLAVLKGRGGYSRNICSTQTGCNCVLLPQLCDVEPTNTCRSAPEVSQWLSEVASKRDFGLQNTISSYNPPRQCCKKVREFFSTVQKYDRVECFQRVGTPAMLPQSQENVNTFSIS